MTDISRADFGTRAYAVLVNNGMSELEDIAELTHKELLGLPNCGVTTIRQIEAVLAFHNLKLQDHSKDILVETIKRLTLKSRWMMKELHRINARIDAAQKELDAL